MILLNTRYYMLLTVCLLLLSCNDSGDIPMYGCLDPGSENYCDDCTVDDGSCDCGVEDGEYTYTFSDILTTIDEWPWPEQGKRCLDCHDYDYADYGAVFTIQDYNSVKERVNGCGSVETSKLLVEITTGLMQSYATDDLVEMIEIWISEGAPE